MSMKKQKVCIITGGAQGIGKGISLCLLKSGYAVIAADIDRQAGKECVQEYKSLGPVEFIRTDVGNEASVKQCVKRTVAKFKRIDALVNNAFLSGTKKPMTSKGHGSLVQAKWLVFRDTDHHREG